MGLLQRIWAATLLWWAIVVSGEIECLDEPKDASDVHESTLESIRKVRAGDYGD